MKLCALCKHYEPELNLDEDLNEAFGICRKNPPQVNSYSYKSETSYGDEVEEVASESCWPAVRGNDWCGAYEARSDNAALNGHEMKVCCGETYVEDSYEVWVDENDLFELKTHQAQQVTIRRREYRKGSDLRCVVKWQPEKFLKRKEQ